MKIKTVLDLCWEELAAGVVFTDDPKEMIGWFNDGAEGGGEIQFQLTEIQEQLYDSKTVV
jgi:hypothetical protein